ncbi:secretory carrier membrane protein 2, like [Boleophthalmus pectinirostris]|uniref:secretory carrier membrane protein 2, like n=1 Tax=Boleophthalmus pectinirostris TaxID=150288 RepID=UPI000A1C7009|nr:secretory carrier membrane protein 2, like [Boleophthalmus pectinirostris]
MSDFDSNPFADPVDVNPFQDASVTTATSGVTEKLGDYNPFSAPGQGSYSVTGTTVPISAVPSSQPAVLQTSVEQSAKGNASAAAASLAKQQEELERKAAELERKERELESRSAPRPNSGVKENNWPPLPKFFPVKPCFYQDFEEEIPEEYRRICRRMYYLWMFHSATLFLNVLGCLAYFTVNANSHGVDFGLSILWFVLFTPVAFVCWYRPVYKAFRSDSSFSFFFFFFVFFFQVVVYIIQTVGIPGWGNSGWIAAISMIQQNLAVAVTMMVVAGFFTVNSVLGVILLKMVHSKYRRTGASFTKAQQEFSQGVLTNRTFQTAASSAASSAAQGAFSRN